MVTLGSRQNGVKPALAYAAALYICIDGFREFGFCSIVVEKNKQYKSVSGGLAQW